MPRSGEPSARLLLQQQQQQPATRQDDKQLRLKKSWETELSNAFGRSERRTTATTTTTTTTRTTTTTAQQKREISKATMNVMVMMWNTGRFDDVEWTAENVRKE
jgi:hypothetical protein